MKTPKTRLDTVSSVSLFKVAREQVEKSELTDPLLMGLSNRIVFFGSA